MKSIINGTVNGISEGAKAGGKLSLATFSAAATLSYFDMLFSHTGPICTNAKGDIDGKCERLQPNRQNVFALLTIALAFTAPALGAAIGGIYGATTSTCTALFGNNKQTEKAGAITSGLHAKPIH